MENMSSATTKMEVKAAAINVINEDKDWMLVSGGDDAQIMNHGMLPSNMMLAFCFMVSKLKGKDSLKKHFIKKMLSFISESLVKMVPEDEPKTTK